MYYLVVVALLATHFHSSFAVKTDNSEVPRTQTFRRLNNLGEVQDNTDPLGADTYGLFIFKVIFSKPVATEGEFVYLETNDRDVFPERKLAFDRGDQLPFFYNTHGRKSGEKVSFAIGTETYHFTV